MRAERFIVVLLLSIVGVVLLLSEQLGADFDLTKFLILKTIGFALLAIAMRVGGMKFKQDI